MQLADKFSKPIVTFIDTPGAYPGLGAEERGQAEAIARNLREMAALRTPVIAVVTGEGGSGGALAIGVANRVLMLEHADLLRDLAGGLRGHPLGRRRQGARGGPAHAHHRSGSAEGRGDRRA